MAIKKRRVNYTFSKVGDRVRSKKVGAKEAFVGRIVEIKSSRAIVRDPQNKDWIREWCELEGA